MADNWHGYFTVERGTIGQGNWDTLLSLFEGMGSEGLSMPAYNNHWRTSLNGDKVIYESLFDPDEVSIAQFKTLLAATFGVPVEDIETTSSQVTYVSHPTRVWGFLYSSVLRFTVRRFAEGERWSLSRRETEGYILTALSEWEETEE